MPQDFAIGTQTSAPDTTNVAAVTSNALSTTFNGFTIGADLQSASDVLYWEAGK